VEITGSDQSGVAGFDQATITADSCQFDRNGHWNVVLTGQSQVRLSNCTLSGAQFANLDASDSARVELRNCRIEKGQRFGLFITGNSELDIAGSSICKHANRGIEMQNIASLRIASTSVSENGDYGVILFERSRIKATECNFARNGGHGVSLRNQASGLFEQCEFSNNRFSGLGCLDAHDGGVVRATQCAFHGNGMRPIYRGPLHLDPLVPTPLTIDDLTVTCLADPRASVELYLDRVGEASHYLRTIQADSRGRFRVSRAEVPEGYVMTAAATVDGATSEFNVIAGSSSADVIGALLARTGPLSDIGGRIDLDGDLRRWRTGTRLILYLPDPPSVAVQQYAQFFASHVSDWTCGAVRAELNTAAVPPVAQEDTIVVSVRYVPADSNQLLGRGGVTIMKWDLQGYFVDPMKILLASCKDADETCPRVLAHEFGHVLGLCHVRVGLLSRMQGSTPPSSSFVNDFSPTLTFYDVLALHTLHSPEIAAPATLRQVAAAGSLPPSSRNTMASAVQDDSDHVTYSPSADNSSPDQQNTRPTQRFRQPN
ncbi:MAG: right-handed parallel beta-helix repeat-containing protein, partial [Phycisphaerae bacterium]|nr:right-handed parallel beta-helix repeat-containing protein [Phycisphaerae bacterium]